jgi:hypothetical protein
VLPRRQERLLAAGAGQNHCASAAAMLQETKERGCMRPKAIVAFERLYLGSVAVGLFQSIMNWNKTINLLGKSEFGAAFFAISFAATLGMIVLLILLISRQRSKISRWILLFFLALGLVQLVLHPSRKFVSPEAGFAYALQTIMQIIGAALLFTPSARRWIRREDSHDELTHTFS